VVVRVGHGSAILPVPEGSALGGYADRDGGSTGVLEELQVDCVCLSGAHGRLVLVVAEVVCVNADLADEVRRRVGDAVPAVDVWICATHTHSGPDVGCVAGGGPTPAQWRSAIGDAAVDAARVAAARERSCAGRFHTGTLRDVGSHRGRHDGEHEVSVDVVSCVGPDGEVEGVLAVVPVHPTVLPAASTLVSGDLAAAIRSALRQALGCPWVVVATGPAGDISTRHTRRAQTADECRRLGAEAAEQTAALMQRPAAPLWERDAGGCAAQRRTLAMPARQQDPDELLRVRDALERELQSATTATARIVETALQGVEVAQAAEANTVALEVSAARVGRLALFGIGAEPYHSFGSQLRDECAGPTVVLGYTNGHVGYLPDAAAYATDPTGYEVLSSLLPPEAAATTVATLTELLPDPTED
jgi:hypothetical protein